MIERLLLVLAGLSLCLYSSGCREEAAYPARPLNMICPWSVGGGTDRVSRQIAFFLEHELDVPVNVINATGGRGVTGHGRILGARADGYTLGMVTLELNMLHWQDLTSITWQDAEPLLSVNEDAAAIWVRRDSPWSSIDQLLDDVRRNPGQLTASGTASGGAWHLALAGWLEAAGLKPQDIKWIPMNGSAPSLQELMSGGIDLVCCSLPEARTRLADFRCLAVMSESRVPGWDDVPTMVEMGIDWTLVGWRGLAVPVGTPPDRVRRLVEALRRIVTGETRIQGKTFPDFMRSEGFNNRWRAPEAFGAFLQTNDAKFGRLLTSPAFATIGTGRVGPMLYPAGLAVIGTLLLGLLVTRHRKALQATEPAADVHVNRGAAVITLIVMYLLAAEWLGFVLTAGCLLFLMQLLLGAHWLTSLMTTGTFVPVTYYVFAHLLRVPLPRGLIDL